MDPVVFQTRIAGVLSEVKIVAVECGSNRLPEHRFPDAMSGAQIYLQAVQDNRNVSGPEHLQSILRQEHQGNRIMAKKDPHDLNRPICWHPADTTIKAL